jgi:TolB-like protein
MSFIEELKRRNVLRVGLAYLAVSWLLIQVADTIFPAYGLPASALTILITILAVGFVPVLVFAWAFELTPEGIKKDSEVDRDAPATLGAGKTLDRVIMIVLALALGFFAFDKFVLDPARDAEIIESVTQRLRTEALYESYGDKSIVVLPFVNMSPDPDQEYFADGISEELLNLLSRIQELRVISRTSAFSFKGKDVDIPTVAEKLKVDHVLEGSVRKSGNRIRITTQLIDARTDSHLWSETYDRTLDDIFKIQDEIAAEIVEQLRITLLGKSPETRKIDPEAYVLYLQARHLTWSPDSDGMIQAETLLKQVLALEPDYVPAMNELSVVYDRQGKHFDIRSREEGKRLFEEMNRKALGVDPDDAVATAILAWRHMEDQLDPAGAARLFEEAIASDPTDEDIVRAAGSFARMIGRPDQAIALGEYAIARNPRCAGCFHTLSMAYRDSGRFEEAEANGKIARALGMRLDYSIAKTKLQQGRAEEALLVFEQMDGRNHQKLHAMAMALYSLGRQAEFEATFAELRKRWGDEQPIFIALVYSWAGDTDAAFAWLDRAIEKEAFAVIRVYASPFFRNLHADPRWDAILEIIGRSPEQLAAIEFNVMLPLSSADSN